MVIAEYSVLNKYKPNNRETLTTVTMIMFSFKPPKLLPLLLIDNENEGGYVTLSSRAGHLAPTSYHPSPTQFVLLCVFSNIHAMDPEKQTFSTNCSFFHSKSIWRELVQLFWPNILFDFFATHYWSRTWVGLFWSQPKRNTCWVSLSFCSFGQITKCTSTENQMQIYFHFQTSSISLDHLEKRSSTKPCVVLVKVPVTVVDVMVEQLSCPEQWWWWWWWLGGRGWWGESPREALQRGFPHKSDCGSLALLVVAPFNRCANLTTVKTSSYSHLAWEEVLIYDRPEEIKNWSVMAANTWSGQNWWWFDLKSHHISKSWH